MSSFDERKDGETLADLSKVGLATWYDSYAVCVGYDIYKDLRCSHKTDYTYSMEFCQFTNQHYLVRMYTSKRVRKKDPYYFSLSHRRWYGDEYTLKCVLPKFAIPNPWTLSEFCRREMPGVEMYWVSIENRIHETPVIEDVLCGAIDQFHVFGSDRDSKRKWQSLSAMNKKRKLLDTELRRVLSE